MPETEKMALYMDVDGVLFQMKPGGRDPNLRPMASDFICWCDRLFACRWLTAWPEKNIQQLCHLIYAPVGATWPWVAWERYKSESICFDDDFVWVDDDPMPQDEENLTMFKKRGRIQMLLQAAPDRTRELERIQRELERLLDAYGGQGNDDVDGA